MLRSSHIYNLNWIVSLAMLFSMGCLFGAEHPGIPFIVWIGVIFFGAGMKVWLHHQAEKIQPSQREFETSAECRKSHEDGGGTAQKD